MENVIYVGFESTPVADWRGLVTEPVAPASYTKADTIAAWLVKSKEKQQQEAATKPLTGSLKTVVYLQNNKCMRLDDKDDPLEFLSDARVPAIVGLDIFTFLNLAISRSIDLNGKLDWKYHWAKLGSMTRKPYFPLDNRVREKFVLDPLSALNGGEYSGEEIQLICKRFKINMPETSGALGAAELAVSAGHVLGF